MNCICDSSHCTSCLACCEYCDGAIKFGLGHNGFPLVNINCNVQCRECSFSCPQIIPITKHNKPTAYAVQLKNPCDLLKSTSGGMFSLLAQYTFENHGVVFGAVYDEDMRVHHELAEHYEQIENMRGSKYVLSDISSVYKTLKSKIDEGRKVLFVGLPCQIAGIYAYLGKNPDNLITADLVCSGVPSAFLFDQYIKSIEMQKKIKILDYKFRDKSQYGVSHTVVITYKTRSGKIEQITIPDRRKVSYYVAFGNQNCFMDACYDCYYNDIHRISDFTLGGFWNIANCDSQLNEHDGVSLVLASTEKAEAIIAWGKEHANIEMHNLELATEKNSAITHKNLSRNQSKEIHESLLNKGYQKTAKVFFRPRTIVGSIVSRIKKVYIGK